MNAVLVPSQSRPVPEQRAIAATEERPPLLSREDFELLVGEYAERLQSVARRYFRSAEDAADAVQDALLSAYTARGSFQGQSTVYTWLYRIVTNACLMKTRARQVRSRRGCDMSHAVCPSELEPADAAASSPIERLELKETQAALHAKIDKLPRDYRTVLRLRDIDELSTRETAERLQVSTSLVKIRVHRARQALRSLLVASPDFSG